MLRGESRCTRALTLCNKGEKKTPLHIENEYCMPAQTNSLGKRFKNHLSNENRYPCILHEWGTHGKLRKSKYSLFFSYYSSSYLANCFQFSAFQCWFCRFVCNVYTCGTLLICIFIFTSFICIICIWCIMLVYWWSSNTGKYLYIYLWGETFSVREWKWCESKESGVPFAQERSKNELGYNVKMGVWDRNLKSSQWKKARRLLRDSKSSTR